MNYKFRPLIFLTLVSPLLVQCVPTSQDITTLDLRIRNLDNRMLKVDQKVKHIEKNVGQNDPIETIQKRQAELSDALDRLNMEFLQIKGQLEENSHFYQNTRKESEQIKMLLEKKVADLTEQIMLLADQLNQTSDTIDTVKQSSLDAASKAQAAETRAKEIEQQAAKAIAEAKKKAEKAALEAKEAREALAAKKSANRKPELTPNSVKLKYQNGKKPTQAATASHTAELTGQGPGKDIYDRALSLFRQSKFNQAYRVFADYIEQYPDGKMAPNARFWLGDCYYNQQEYELAILEYQKVIAEHAKHPKAPAALLKQGLAFEKLKDNETAKIVYRKLQEEYPKSEQVATAKKRIELL